MYRRNGRPGSAIDQQHELRGAERTHGQNDEPAGDQSHPGKERHFAKGHARAAHAKNCGDDVDGGANAAEAGNEQAERPEIGAVSDGECTGSQRSVGEPTDIGRVSGAI